MRQALADAGESLPPPAPLVLAGMVDHADPHPTRVAATGASAQLFDQDEATCGPNPKLRRRPHRRPTETVRVAGAWCPSWSGS